MLQHGGGGKIIRRALGITGIAATTVCMMLVVGRSTVVAAHQEEATQNHSPASKASADSQSPAAPSSALPPMGTARRAPLILSTPDLTSDTPWPSAAWAAAIDKLINAGRLPEARERLKVEAVARGETYQGHYLEAKILFKEKRFEASLQELKRCLALTESDPQAYMLVASNAIALNRNDIAERALLSAIQLAPDDYLAHFHLGALYYTIQGRVSDGNKEFQEVVKAKPDFMRGQLFLGMTMEDRGGEAQGAIDCYQRAMALVDVQKLKDGQPFLRMGRILTRLNRPAESLPYLQRAVEMDPRLGEAWYVLGKALDSLGREPEAVNALQESVRVAPRYSDPHYLLGRIYAKQKRLAEAQKEMKVFQELKDAEPKETATRP